MQHYVKTGMELKAEEKLSFERYDIHTLQCGDSLAIAANSIGEDREIRARYYQRFRSVLLCLRS